MSTFTVGLGDSVQAAIDAASSGDRIEIAAGSFQEGIDVGSKSLTLVGAGSASTTIGGTRVAVCLTASGGDLVLQDLSIAGCDTLVAAAGGSFAFTNVELWGSDDPGTAEGVDWTWNGGALSLVNGPLTVSDATVNWDGIAISDNTSATNTVVLEDCVTGLVGVEIWDNNLSTRPIGLIYAGGGTVDATGLNAHDNVMANPYEDNGVLTVDGGALATVADSAFTDNAAAAIYVPDGSIEAGNTLFARNSAAISYGHLTVWHNGTTPATTHDCTFDTNTQGVYSVEWTSTDDVFTGATGAQAGWELDATVSGTTFTGYDDATYVLGGTFDLSDVSVDGGLVSGSGSIVDSAFAGSGLVGVFDIARSTFAGRGGTAFGGATTGVDLTISGYDLVSGGYPLDLRSCTIADVGTLGTFDGYDVTLDGVTLQTTGDGLATTDGTVTLSNTDITAGDHGLKLASTTTLTDVTIASTASGISQGGGSLTASGLDIVAGANGIVTTAAHTNYMAVITLDDTTIEAEGGFGVLATRSVFAALTASNTSIVASESGIGVQDAESGMNAHLESVTIEAWTGVALGESGSFFAGVDVSVRAGGTGAVLPRGTWAGGSLHAGGDGITGPALALGDLQITAGGSCVSSAVIDIDGLTCTAGGAPLLLQDAGTLADIVVQDSTSTSPSVITSSTATLTNVRFLGNTTTSGAGALRIEDSTVTATGLNFQGNTGVDAGALVISNSTGTVTGSVFRDNVASAGPGAVLDDGGLAWGCSIFEHNQGTAGDIEFDQVGGLDHVTLSGSSATEGAVVLGAPYVTLDSSIVTAGTGAGIFGPGSTRTAFFTYSDVWGNSGGDWAGGIADPTGTNGNIAADPQLDVELFPASGSPVRDAGDPAMSDSDGTPSDMGARAAVCPELDFDGDGQLPSAGDCDDDQAAASLGATEIPCDGIDNDCAGDGDDTDCPTDTGDSGDTEADADTDSDADSDTDTDSDSDTDADADTDTDADGGGKSKGCATAPTDGSAALGIVGALIMGWRRRGRYAPPA